MESWSGAMKLSFEVEFGVEWSQVLNTSTWNQTTINSLEWLNTKR